MTKSQLPEITLTCRNDHPIKTRARGGQSIKCQACGAFKKVPAARPRTAREAVSAAAEHEDQDHELTARWEREPHWDGRQLPDLPGRAGDLCPECAEPVIWEPGRTWTACEACPDGTISLPPAVAAHYERQASQRAQVAVRGASGAPATPAERARLRARKEMARKDAESWLDGPADPDSYDRVQWEAQADQLGALLRGWIQEIDQAPDATALDAVRGEIRDLLTGELARTLASEYEAAQLRAAQQHDARVRAAEYERAQQEAARIAERAARAAEVEQARERKAITGGRPAANGTRVTAEPYPVAVAFAAMIERNRQAKTRKIDEHGPCAYDGHRKPEIAARRYWIAVLDWQGNETNQAVPGSPQIAVCKKHSATADKWMEEQAAAIGSRTGYPVRAVYLELT